MTKTFLLHLSRFTNTIYDQTFIWKSNHKKKNYVYKCSWAKIGKKKNKNKECEIQNGKKREVLHITKHQNKEIMKKNLFMCMCFTNVSRYENIILLKREKKVKRILDSVKWVHMWHPTVQ